MTRRAVVLALTLACLAAPMRIGRAQSAGGRDFDFRGHRLGDSLWAARWMECHVETLQRLCQEQTKVGDTDVIAYYQFQERHLTGVQLVFEPENYEAMLGALRAKYGPPDSSVVVPLENRMGAGFQSREVSWMFAAGTLWIREYTSKVTRSVIEIFSHAGLARMRAKQDSISQKAKDDL